MRIGCGFLDWLRAHRSPGPLDGLVHDMLLEQMGRVHASAVNASIRRDGEWPSLSYTHELGRGARKLVEVSMGGSVAAFRTVCELLSNSLPEARELLIQGERLMTSTYTELLHTVEESARGLYRGQLSGDRQFWIDSANEWGKGSGYLDRVLDRNRAWFQEPSRRALQADLESLLDREWAALLHRVQAIFEQP
ncbi:hypothetical protein [Catenuloplanes japonicus]|uniref:hypothetical protein n=1 Tax=Catenuloplanes japonicus TaxID=33876 RepID=UPI0005272D18|nr:hypothetical protein [Catenuloplanes japonicus]